MLLRAIFFSLAWFAALGGVAGAQSPDPVTLVDPFVGTSGTKIGGPIDTFPGADAPFGMVQFSPDTPGQPAGGGYDYKDTAITGFSLDHLSGPGCSVFGDFGILPVRSRPANPAQAKSSFSHTGESASPGYYSVVLGAGIHAELTSGTRSAIGRFTFPAGAQGTILVNAASNQAGVNDSSIRVVSPTQIEGWATSGQFCGMPDTYTVYFAAQFDRPMTDSGVWGGGRGTADGAWAQFDTSGNRTVTVRVALSWVDQNGAWENLRSGLSDFDTQRTRTSQLWNSYLQRVSVTGGTPEQQRTFYTALYHVLLHPNLYSDVDGRYRGFDNAIHRARTGHDEYATFSGWDIYRTQAPLAALIAPRETSDMMQSLVDAAKQGGWLPKWPLVNGYSAVMGGDPAAPIIAGAYAFGAREFDLRGALSAMIKNASDGASAPGQGWYRPRPGFDEYQTLGYVVNTHTTNVSPVPNGASLTLEYAVADFSIAQFARALGDMRAYHTYLLHSQRWRNLFDTRTGFIAPRDPSGAFEQTPVTGNGQSGFQEGNAAQYTWMVPQDYAGLVYGMGGRKATVDRLDEFFSQLNAGQDKPYAWLGNEPSLGDPWVYSSAGAPAKGERVIAQALATLYGDTPDGIPGNDDLGTMSAWYVWCAIGLYPQNPAAPVLDLGSPLFTSVRIAVPGGAQIAIDAPSASAQNTYVQSVRVNGREQQATWVRLPVRGSLHIAFDLGSTPGAWGTGVHDAPPSYEATPPSFPPATAASFASGDRLVNLASGGRASLNVQLANSARGAAETVAWRAQAPAGITVTPSSGTASSDGALHLDVAAQAGMPARYYPLTISARAANGAVLTPWKASVRTGEPGTQILLGYVANFSDNTVAAFDPQTGAIAAVVAVGNNPGDVALTPDRSRLLVANQGSNTVSVVDTATFAVVATIKTGKVPASIRVEKNGLIAWVTDYGDNAVQAIDITKASAGPLIPVGRNPEQLALAPGGAMLYAVNQGDNNVTPIDLQTHKALDPIPVGARPTGIVIDASGATAYVSDSGANAVTPIDLRSGRAGAPIAVGVAPQGMALDRSGSRLYVADSGSDTVSIVDTARGARIAQRRVGLNPQAVAISADGGTLFAVAMSDNALVKIPIESAGKPSAMQIGNVPLALTLP